MKKPLTELTDEEIIDLVGQNPSNLEKVYNWPTDVMDFISYYNLKQGTEVVTSKLLYRLYRHWSKDPIPSKAFTSTLTDIFPSNRLGHSITILLDKSALNIHNELSKYLESMDKTKYKNWTKHFTTYLNHYSIKKGGLFINNNVLYNLYDKWCYKNHSKHLLGHKQFNKFCKLFFKHKVVKDQLWYAIDDSIKTHLTEDLINLMYKKKTNAKKENKTK
jgi:hypothetical protein